MPDAGYTDDPGPIPFLSKLIIPGDYPKTAMDITIVGRRFECWSPNSRRLPFYPGIKAPGVDLEDLAKGKKRYDGHLGPLDPTYHPQHYQPRRPYLPFIKRHSHLNPPSQFPEFASLFDGTEVWTPYPESGIGEGRVTESYIRRLKKRNASLLQDVKNSRDKLRNSHMKQDRLLWQNRPLYPNSFHIDALQEINAFEEAVDTITEMQRGIKLRDAWVSYARLKDQVPLDPNDLPYIFAVEVNEQYMGVWMSDEVYDDALLYLTRAGVACFFLHEYTPEEAVFHHHTHTSYPDPIMQNYALISRGDGPWKYAVRRSKLRERELTLEEGESVGRVRKRPDTLPKPYSLSLSNRQGYRAPSLRNDQTQPAAQPLVELALRPVTPVKFSRYLDGLETGVSPAISLADAKARHAALTRPAKRAEIAVTTAPPLTDVKGKGKRKESTPLPDYESESEVKGDTRPLESFTVVSRELAADVTARREIWNTLTQNSSASSSTLSSQPPVTTRARELYAAYSLEISEYWRIDGLPRDVTSPKDLLDLFQTIARKIPFAVQQVLRTWRGKRAVYWVRFGDKDQALRVRGCLASASISGADGCDGPLVAESVYLLALEEVGNPEERPLSPTGYWNLPIDVSFLKAATHLHEVTPLPMPVPRHESSTPAQPRKSITPDQTTVNYHSPPSPSNRRLHKKSRICSPPRHFIASGSTRAIPEASTHRASYKRKSLSEKIDSEPPSQTEEPYSTARPKGPDSRTTHNRQRYHRKLPLNPS